MQFRNCLVKYSQTNTNRLHFSIDALILQPAISMFILLFNFKRLIQGKYFIGVHFYKCTLCAIVQICTRLRCLQFYIICRCSLFTFVHYSQQYNVLSFEMSTHVKWSQSYTVYCYTLFTVVHCLHLYIVYICILFTVIHCLQHSVGKTLNSVDLFFSLKLVLPMWHSTTVILCVFYLIAIRITILNCNKCMQLFVQIKVVFKTSICCKTPIALNLFDFLSNLCID